MKLRTRFIALVLTILIAVETPLTAFAGTGLSTDPAVNGDIVVVNEDGTQQVLTGEDLTNGTDLPDNITVTSGDETGAEQTAEDTVVEPPVETEPEEPAPAPDVTPEEPENADGTDGAVNKPAPDSSVQEDDSAVSGSEVQKDDSAVSGSEVQEDDSAVSGSEVQEDDSAVSGSSEAQEETSEEEPRLPAIYWNPGSGYEVEASYLGDAEEDDSASSDSSSASSDSASASSDSASASSDSASASSDSASASGDSASASSDSSSASSDSSGSSSDSSGSSSDSSGSGSVSSGSGSDSSGSGSDSSGSSSDSSGSGSDSSGSGSDSSGSGSDSSGATTGPVESTPAESTPVESTPVESTPVESTPVESTPVEPSEEVSEDTPPAAPEDSAMTPAEEESLLARLNPVQTAHAADGAPDARAAEQGLLARIWNWLVSLFRSIFFGAEAADRVPEGSDENDGRSPLAPVKTFEAAMERARELAEQMGVPVDQVTIYSMNPLEVGVGEYVEIDGELTVLKPWEGRSYDSDLLFYVKGGSLSLRQVLLAPRSLESLDDLTARLVQVFDGSVVLENDVSAYGVFVVDFFDEETPKAWPTEADLLTVKTGDPVIELGQNFAVAGPGYSIYLKDQSDEARREVIRAPYLDQASLESVAGSFSLVEETAQQWNLEVGAQQPAPQLLMAAANAVGGGQSPASASLYAVRAASEKVIYWNPGGEFDIDDVKYPAGSDTDRTGLSSNACLKTLRKAIEFAQKNNTNRIVCMQTIHINAESAEKIKEYLPYDSASGTFQLHGETAGGKTLVISNWDQGLPIATVSDGCKVSLKNVTLMGYATSGGATSREGNLMTVDLGGQLTMYENASVAAGSYVQLEFGATEEPLPILVDSVVGTGGTVHAAGVAYAPHFVGTPVVQATDRLATELGKQTAGEKLLATFDLAKENREPSGDTDQPQVAWDLKQDPTPQQEHRLILTTSKEYVVGPIYLDPQRGDDTYEGVNCLFPVKTLDRALEALDEAMDAAVAKRIAAKEGGATASTIERDYPLPGPIVVCSTVVVDQDATWDWSEYAWTDHDGTILKPELCAHEEPWEDALNKPLHTVPEFVVRVDGASLTLGQDVRIGRDLGSASDTSELKRSAINVINGGSLTLTSNATLFGDGDNTLSSTSSMFYVKYPGNGIVAGKSSASSSTLSQATVTLPAEWTGSIQGFGRGVLLAGPNTTMTMDGGSITGNKNNTRGGGVLMSDSATFTMNGGTISGNWSGSGGGVMVYGNSSGAVCKFTMTAGCIENNSAIANNLDVLGAGVAVYYGEFEMGTPGGDNSACVITGNKMERLFRSIDDVYGVGVGVYGYNSNSSYSFTMHSGSITNNTVDDATFISGGTYIYGLGIGCRDVDRVLMEKGLISGNRVDYVSLGSYTYIYVYGTIYLKTADGRISSLSNLTIENNTLHHRSSDYLTTMGGGLCVDNTSECTIVMEDCTVQGNTAEFGGGIAATSNGSYGNTSLRLNNVTVTGNTAVEDGGGIYGLIGWASGLTVTNNRAGDWGGGLCITGDYSSYHNGATQAVLSDCTITGNSAKSRGGGIYFSNSTSISLTITETAKGNTSITGNTAEYGGGLYLVRNSTAPVYLNFDSEWANTATVDGSNIYFYAYNASLYLLKGTLKSKAADVENIYLTNYSGSYTGKFYLDPSAVVLTPATQGGSTIYMGHTNTTIYLLTAGSSAMPLSVSLRTGSFGASNVLVRPANLSSVTVGALSASETAPGGHTVGSASISFGTALKNAGQSSASGEDWSDYITVKDLPLRTQVGEEPDKNNSTLTNLALIGEGVYLNGVSGDDSKDGLSPGKAVRTWAKARQLLEQYSKTPPAGTQEGAGFQPTIWICGTVTLPDGQVVELPQSVVSQEYKDFETQEKRTPKRAMVMRLASYNEDPLFKVESGATVTMKNLRVDGNSGVLAQPKSDAYNVYVSGTLKVGNGARLYNSYGSCVYVYGGRLEVTQSFAPTQTNADTDEGYGLQISDDTSASASDASAVYLTGSTPELVMSGYALVGGNASSTYGVRLSSSTASLTMTGNSEIDAYFCVYRGASGGGTVSMQDASRMEGTYTFNTAVSNNLITWTMEDTSSLDASSYLYGSSTSSFSFTMLDQTTAEGQWVFGTSTSTTAPTGSLKIVLGRENGDDTPVLTIGSGSSPIKAYQGGHLYLEMNASSVLEGAVSFYGLKKTGASDEQKGLTYGILMRDNAKIDTGNSYGVRLGMETSYSQTWDQEAPFAITLEENASIQAASYPFYAYQGLDSAVTEATVRQNYVMGDGQTITLRGNASLDCNGSQGAFYIRCSLGENNLTLDPDAMLPFSHVVIEDDVSITVKETSNTSDEVRTAALITARKVTLRDNVQLPGVGNTAFNDLTYGQGASVKAWEVELDGSVSLEKAICLVGQTTAGGAVGAITLTSPITIEGKYRLQTSDSCMGKIVVKPDGVKVTDVSGYLGRFEKVAGKGDANSVELQADSPNIVLDRLWNVYLSSNGNDNNDGSTPNMAVRTFARAKEILTETQGYGEGSDIIIPDTVSILSADKNWSFEEGGVLTNTEGEVWKPLVRRDYGATYDQPTIVVGSNAYSGNSDPVVFENITLDAGGGRVDFQITGDQKASYHSTMLYINAGSSTREVHLGQGAVLRNLQWDMGSKSFDSDYYIGGFAVHLGYGKLVMNGGVIEDFEIRNFGMTSTTSSNASRVQHAAIVSLEGSACTLELKQGAIRNNTLDVRRHGSARASNATAILAVTGGADLIISGGEISGNVLSGEGWSADIADGYYGYNSATRRRTVGVIALSGSNSSLAMSGGAVRNNTNRLGIDPVPADFGYSDVEGIISIGTQGGYYASSSNTDAVYNRCTFTMTGGSITGNTARHGAAFAVLNGTAKLTGGTIRDNASIVPPPSGESNGWKAQYCPIYVNNERDTALYLDGSGCVADDPMYLNEGRQIIVTSGLRQTNRVYEVYTGSGETAAGNVVVIPDGNKVLNVTPYLHNFHVHAKGMVLDRGRDYRDVTTQLGPIDERACLVQMKAVFINGDSGTDPSAVSLTTPQDVYGRSPGQPVKTLDAAKAVGQALCYAGEASYDHAEHKNHYVVYATGTVYNDCYDGSITGGTLFNKNTDDNDFWFSLEGAAYLCRYTGWELCMGNGTHQKGEHCYDSLIKVKSGATGELAGITVRGRREIDGDQTNGEALVVVESGATLKIWGVVVLERNTASGARPDEDEPTLQVPINSDGGALRAEAGASIIMEGGVIDNTCTAVNGGSIYLSGGNETQTAAQLTLKNAVNIGGQVYLGGQQGYDTPILLDGSFDPVLDLSIAIESDYHQKPIATWTDGTVVDKDMAELFQFSTSVTALYEILPGKRSEADDHLNSLVLNLRQTLYLDPKFGNDERNDGKTPETAVRTIGKIYDMLGTGEDVPGVLVFVMNPVVVEKNRCVTLINGSVESEGVTHYISLYSEGAIRQDFDSSPSIVDTGAGIKEIKSQLYFKRYVRTSDTPPPAGYDEPSNLAELFIVEGQLQLNGVYLDGHSNTTQSAIAGQSADGVVAQAPLVRVDSTGSVQFLTGKLENHTVNGSNYLVGSTLLTNNINNKIKTKTLPGTENVVEGTSAGIEILSANTDLGFDREQRGKAYLMNTRLVNLQLGSDPGGKVIIGGSDIYQNGELTISSNTYFEGSVFLEGNGKEGTSDEAREAQKTSRWLGIKDYGSPLEDAFELLMRDSYHNRRVVRCPYSTNNHVENISYYMLNREVSLYFTLIEELVEKGDENDILGTGENSLWLRVPQAVYIDPTNGSDANDGQYPNDAVRTLPTAFEKMQGLSAKVLYVMDTISITGSSVIYPDGYIYGSTEVKLPSTSVHLEIRRFVTPDVATGDQAASYTNYNEPSFTDGPLFRVKNGGKLTIEGSVLINGHSEPMKGDNVPPEQAVAAATPLSAPLIEVQQGGRLELNVDSTTGERATLANNHNTATAADRLDGGAIYNKGGLYLNGGVLTNNKALAVTSAGTTGVTGNADGIYQAGDLTVSAYPQGLAGQGVYLASDVSTNTSGTVNFTGDHILVMDMRLKDQTVTGGGSLKYALDMDNAVAGRQVVSYPGDSNVDTEYASYTLGNTVPQELFLVESADMSNNLELQDWQFLDVSVPEEVFLAVYEYKTADASAPYGSGAYTSVARVDVSGPNYGVPEYTITNNGVHSAKVTVTGFTQTDWDDTQSAQSVQLAANTAALNSTSPLLYLAMKASSESAQDGNQFSTLAETPLNTGASLTKELGVLEAGEHGSFAFTGAANAAFMSTWLDSTFPVGSLETAETRMAHMRNKDAAGNTSLNKAAAQFELTYRIEIEPDRR